MVNPQEALRTCECLGIQNVWLIGSNAEASTSEAANPWRPQGGAPARWLSLSTFRSSAECVSALREDGREIWATDLAQSAERLDHVLQWCGVNGAGGGAAANGGGGEVVGAVPVRLAVVFGGSEAEGVSREMLMAAHRRVYLPLHGG